MNMLISRPQSAAFPLEYQNLKRLVDYVLCLLVLPLALPVFAIIALAIALDSEGPIFFIQERIGQGGRRFRMFKFRTMHHNLDDHQHRVFMRAYVRGQIGNNELVNDARKAFVKAFVDSPARANGNDKLIYKPMQAKEVTRVGRILRKTSLDELPQLINILRGEMSLIGPRPNVPWEVEEYKPWHYERLEALPGITGLAQVRGRSSINFDSIVNYDIEYIEKQSLLMDIKILWWSAAVVFKGKGAE